MSLLFYAASMKNDNLIIWVEMTFPLGGSATRTKVFKTLRNFNHHEYIHQAFSKKHCEITVILTDENLW